ncbi:MAG TPA: hypothetical protein VND19_14895 [Acetobacteraceae bacterium]|nr:hypothetical protein [Acetobacteraceae bacterium]
MVTTAVVATDAASKAWPLREPQATDESLPRIRARANPVHHPRNRPASVVMIACRLMQLLNVYWIEPAHEVAASAATGSTDCRRPAGSFDAFLRYQNSGYPKEDDADRDKPGQPGAVDRSLRKPGQANKNRCQRHRELRKPEANFLIMPRERCMLLVQLQK